MPIEHYELARFFELLGQATYYVQHVENSLHHLLALSEFEKPGSVTADEAAAVLGKYRCKTLGGLVSQLEKSAFDVPVERLRRLNGERKWMIHQILKDEQFRLTTDAVYRAQLFQRLEFLIDEVQKLNRLVGNEVVRTTVGKGVALDAIKRALEREMRKVFR